MHSLGSFARAQNDGINKKARRKIGGLKVNPGWVYNWLVSEHIFYQVIAAIGKGVFCSVILV